MVAMVDIEGVWPSINTLQGAIKSGDRLDELERVSSDFVDAPFDYDSI